ncbi:hypothetical protein MNBD_NITROSPINAE02-1388 [hydrothermal vent metagenome]|uniref:histidine kinase n=1 Tax=hydrothermal vent metagenome TaxID=652676 RepID=A0A3B1C5Y9_9ZZZZ
MKYISIGAKLWGVLAFFLLCFISIWVLTYRASVKIDDYLDTSRVEVMKQTVILRLAIHDVDQLITDGTQVKDLDMIAEANEKAKNFLNAINALIKNDPERKAEYEKTLKQFNIYLDNARKMADLIINEGKEITSEEVILRAIKVQETLPGLQTSVDKILDRNYDTFSNLLNKSTVTAAALLNRNSALFLMLLLFSVVIVPLVIQTITKPIKKLRDATNELARGNLDAKSSVTYHDEIGDLATSFNEMTRTLKEKSLELEKTTRELKLVNMELQEADRLKSRFLASMSHELRTPLNAMINFSEQIIEDWDMISTDREWSIEARDMMQRVDKSSKHLLSLINELLDLAKIESGHMNMKLEPSDIRDVVTDAISSVWSLAREKNLKLTQSAQKNLPELLIDERRVLQIILNLIANAIKFTEKGGVHVETVSAGQLPGVYVRVIDTGIGISKKDQTIIFDRFQQADGADSRIYTGAGLGLNLVKEMAELHGGWIKVDSEKGKGSTFILYLPFEASARTS